MPEASAIERLLKRDRAITMVGLAALSALAWLYIVSGAQLGMSAGQMARLALFPANEDVGMAAMPGMAAATVAMAWPPQTWLLMVAMWWAMMIAMMTPSAAPTVLLYARVYRSASSQDRMSRVVAPTGAFVAGYLLLWLAFSLIATALQFLLQRAGVMSALTMGSQTRWLSAGVLVATGLYQWSPWKSACLSHCRSPAAFLSRHWRPGVSGALRLGALHGAYCVGCCWLLMALLFVGGAMNLVWIAVLTLLVMVEKLLATGPWLGRGVGVVLIAWGVATLLV